MSINDSLTLFITTEAKVSIPIHFFVVACFIRWENQKVLFHQFMIRPHCGSGSRRSTRQLVLIYITGTAWKRVQKICYTLKTLCYARQQAAFFKKDWTITVCSNYVKIPKKKKTEKQLKKALKENVQLKKSHDELKSKVLKFSNDVKKCKEAWYNPTHGQTIPKLPFQCSKGHQWNLKQKRKQSCVQSLVWLEQKEYSASKVEIVNRKTGETEIVD